MANFRENLSRFILGDDGRKEQEKLQLSIQRIWEAFLDGGSYQLPPEELVKQLKEYDSNMLADMVLQLQWEQVGSLYSTTAFDYTSMRQRAYGESRRLYLFDPLTKWIIDTWTNFGLGESITITPIDDAAQEVLSEFWNSPQNRSVLGADRIQEQSKTVLKDGELFWLIYVSTIDGKCTMRVLTTDQVNEQFVYSPDDPAVPFWFHRYYQDKNGLIDMYYPNAFTMVTDDFEVLDASSFLPQGVTRGDTYKGDTLAVIIHVPHNLCYGDHGWPIMTAGAAWARAHKQFRENRASVAAAIAMYVQKLKVDGGSRAVDAQKARLQSALNSMNYNETNPSAAPGSTWVENRAATLERMPMSTGAGDAKTDGEALLQMTGLAGGLFPHWLGAGDAYRLATATSMEGPMLRQFSRYQTFWTAQFKILAQVVLWAAEKYGNKKFESYDVEVSMDKLLEVDLQIMTASVTSFWNQFVLPSLQGGLMPKETALQICAYLTRSMMQAYGSEDAEEISKDEDFLALNVPAAEPAPAVPEGAGAEQPGADGDNVEKNPTPPPVEEVAESNGKGAAFRLAEALKMAVHELRGNNGHNS
jgi:hypothetical protein